MSGPIMRVRMPLQLERVYAELSEERAEAFLMCWNQISQISEKAKNIATHEAYLVSETFRATDRSKITTHAKNELMRFFEMGFVFGRAEVETQNANRETKRPKSARDPYKPDTV